MSDDPNKSADMSGVPSIEKLGELSAKFMSSAPKLDQVEPKPFKWQDAAQDMIHIDVYMDKRFANILKQLVEATGVDPGRIMTSAILLMGDINFATNTGLLNHNFIEELRYKIIQKLKEDSGGV